MNGVKLLFCSMISPASEFQRSLASSACLSLKSIYDLRWVWSNGGMTLTAKTKVLIQKLLPMPLCLSKISGELPQKGSGTFAMNSQRLNQGTDLKPEVNLRDMQNFSSHLTVNTQNYQSERPVLLMLCV
jgi:hypothetical protein